MLDPAVHSDEGILWRCRPVRGFKVAGLVPASPADRLVAEAARRRDGYLLTERSRWIDEGGTWGIPGGAIHHGESPGEAAHRQAAEQIWPVPAYRVTGIEVQDCGGGWKFHIVGADIDAPFTAYTARDTDATGWFTMPEMRGLRLYSGIRRWVDEHPRPDA